MIRIAREGNNKLVTVTLDTVAYAANDVLFPTQEVTNITPTDGGTAFLQSLLVIDVDLQNAPIDVIFFDDDVSIGTLNNPEALVDADASNILGIESFASGSYTSLANISVGNIPTRTRFNTKSNTRSIFMAAKINAIHTYASGTMHFRLRYAID